MSKTKYIKEKAKSLGIMFLVASIMNFAIIKILKYFDYSYISLLTATIIQVFIIEIFFIGGEK